MTRYICTHWSNVFAICNIIKATDGVIFAINAPTTKPGEPPDKREIWFFSELTELEIMNKVGTKAEILSAAEVKIPTEFQEAGK